MAECSKRSYDCVDGGRLPKYPRLTLPVIRLESETEFESQLESESELSFQMHDTASARDTSDTSSKSESESEYTLASMSEGEVSEITSGPDDVCIIGNFDQLVSEFGSDISVVADLSDSDKGSTDSEIGKADYWNCAKCGTTNKNPWFRLCIRCFRERKSELPPRPKSRKRISSSQESQSSAIETQDSGLGLSQQSSPPEVSDASETTGEPKCGCCFERPVDSIFLHGDVAHQIFCYKCSQKVWKERKRCPCCNRISKVVKVYRGPLIGGKLLSALSFGEFAPHGTPMNCIVHGLA